VNAPERVRAVLHHETPDQVPFVPYEHLVPRGEFIREMRNRGMWLCTACTPTYWSEWPHVRFTTSTKGTVTTTLWETPEGSVASRCRTHLSREVASRVLYGNAGVERNVLEEGFIKDVQDYTPVIFAIEDEVLHEDYVNYEYAVRDFREDCLVRVAGLSSPYDASYSYFGERTSDGSANWSRAQTDHPDLFTELLEALERRQERLFRVIADAPGEVMQLTGLSGWYGPSYSPEQFEKHSLPFFRKYVPLLRKEGRLLSVKADTPNLSSFADLVPEIGVDILEGFTPPPVGDLSLPEARAAWGDELVIWVNFPESIFWEGAEATRSYTFDLLRGDPGGALVLGMTVIGTSRIVDEQTAQVFEAGMRAIMDAVEAHGSDQHSQRG
jgi:hypothetical protein